MTNQPIGHMYINHYRHCDTEWEDKWLYMCNDKCPVCGKEITPYDSEEIENGAS